MSGATFRYLNPCDYFMRELSIDYPKSQEDEAKMDRFARVYRKTLQPTVMQEMKEFKMPDYTLRDKSSTMAPLCTQYSMLFWRIKVFTVREPAATIAKIGNELLGGLLMVSLFFDVGSMTDPTMLANMLGLITFMITWNYMGNFFASLQVFQQERPVFLREQANKLYNFIPYFFANSAI